MCVIMPWSIARGTAGGKHAAFCDCLLGPYACGVPELPEVETIRRDLEPLAVGRRIVGVEVDAATLPLLAGVPIDALRERLLGRVVTSLGRYGKHLVFGLDDGRAFVAHLRMTGRLLWRESGGPAEVYERARLVLDDGHDLRWSDLRKFGTWRVVNDTREITAGLGPEPIDPSFTLGQFRAALAGRKAPVKAVLLDQRRISGLGNIYVDEALHQARVRPDQTAGLLGPAATKRLFEACRAVLEEGIANRGASFRDYVDGQGEQGRQHMYVKVFRRHGKPCYTCGTTIERIVVAGRGTHFCPTCQPKRGSRRSRS
ncbi:MAG: bifunctional DNA-formamidopyrimidine glycosylase/DNA-(apurinic or apyrimidinic site) lyase [Chloroflexi bacterium CFX7]|nr:MAG: bifunctional DNA-formamidopyrimidine glycosylase/DNA-(apurinic or apyrimidinic site) lyase [bacterium]MCE7928399.1 bifunctional DNA-formamidopyrimidine glycosylase/DNA-(apurinic or apyrimidinic site) lyase [Chloroflexi bacterium CFX7]RIL03407.1 MAG: formamidopyrimidine-DNA glycosylase [bacterium]